MIGDNLTLNRHMMTLRNYCFRCDKDRVIYVFLKNIWKLFTTEKDI